MHNQSHKFHGQISIVGFFMTLFLTVLFTIVSFFIFNGTLYLEGTQKLISLIVVTLPAVIGVVLLVSQLWFVWGYPYKITQEGVLFHNFKKVLIKFSEVQELKKISADEVKAMVRNLQEVDRQRGLYLPQGPVPVSEELRSLIKFQTNAPIIGYSSRGSGFSLFGIGLLFYKVKILQPKVWGDFILVSLKNGQRHILSPKDPGLFLENIGQMSKVEPWA